MCSIHSEIQSFYIDTLVDVILVRATHYVSKLLIDSRWDSGFIKSYVLNLSIKSIKFNVFLFPLAPSGPIAVMELTDMVR